VSFNVTYTEQQQQKKSQSSNGVQIRQISVGSWFSASINISQGSAAKETCLRCGGIVDNKTAELSQRRPRDAPNVWVP